MVRRAWLVGLLLGAQACTAARQHQNVERLAEVDSAVVQTPEACRREWAAERLATADANPGTAIGERALMAVFTGLSRDRCRGLKAEVGERLVREYCSPENCSQVLLELVRDSHHAGELHAAEGAAKRLIERFPDAGDAFEAISWVATLKEEQGDVAGAARALGEFAARTFERSRFGMPRQLLERLAELQREAGAMPDALITAQRLLELDPTNGTAVALQLEQEMTDHPDAPIAPMLERLEAVVKVRGNLTVSLERVTRQVLDFWFQQLERSPPRSREAVDDAYALLSGGHQLFVLGGDQAVVGQLWRKATIAALLVDGLASVARGTRESEDVISESRRQVDMMFAVCAQQASNRNVVTPEATACSKRQRSLAAAGRR